MNSTSENIFLPGGWSLFNHLKSKTDFSGKNILVVGSNPENVAVRFTNSKCESVNIIVNDNDALLNSRLALKDFPLLKIKLMDYIKTDFNDNQFDLIFAQASISTYERNKIIKEIKRILKPEGLLCVGEITTFKDDSPQFMKDIWESGNISPLPHLKAADYYLTRDFKLIDELDLSGTLTEFYADIIKVLKKEKNILSADEKSVHKKLLNRLSHESNAYLKLGGNNYMGFKSIILRKKH